MKRLISFSMILGVVSIAFVGCAYKTEVEKDGYDSQYVDKTYKTTANNSMSNDCKPKCEENILNIENTPPCNPCQEVFTNNKAPMNAPILEKNKTLRISVHGQGVAPCEGSCSPAQSYAMAKRAAIGDSYRLIAEKVKGVYVEGDDLVKNMMVKSSVIRTSVSGTIRNANIVETTFKDGLCDVEMEITLTHSQFAY